MKQKSIFLPTFNQDKTHQAASWLTSLTLLAGCLWHAMLAAPVNAEVRSICLDAYVKAGATPAGTSSRNDDEYIRCYAKAYGALLTLNDWMCAGWPLADNVDIPEFCGAICEPVDGDLGRTGAMLCTRRKNKGKPYDCEGNPCDPITGNKFETETDYRSANGQLNVVRYYNSLAPENGTFGFGWTSSLTFHLSVVSRGTVPHVVVQRPDGRGEVWKKVDGNWKGEADSKLHLEERAGRFLLTSRDVGVEQYDEKGRLLSIVDRYGLLTQYKHDDGGKLVEIVDPWLRKLTLSYNQDGRISKIVTPDGPLLYDYDGQGNLTRAVYPDNTSRQYLYGEKEHVSSSPEPGVSYAHAMTGLVDENNVRFATWSYDKNGKVASSEHAGGVGKVSLEHKDDGSTIVAGPLSDSRTYASAYYHNVAKIKSVKGDQCSDCGNGHMKSRTYDANGNLASSTDAKGNVACYAYDPSRNLETVKLEGLPPGKSCPDDLSSYVPSSAPGSAERKTTTQWHSTFKLPTAVAEPLRLTSYSYDAKGNLTTLTVQATTDETGAAGLNAKQTGLPRTITYAYGKSGQLEVVDGPRMDVSDKTLYSYDAHGNLVSITNALNQATKIENYDSSGRISSVADPNGLLITLSYDLRGRLKFLKKGEEETGYFYDRTGNLTKILLPSGASYAYIYDQSHRLTDIVDKDGSRIHLTFDSNGNRIKEEIMDSNGKVLTVRSREFDKLSRLLKEVGAANQATQYEYDDNGNLVKISDPLNRTIGNQYDTLNRLITSTDPDGNITQYSYDGQNQLERITDPRGLTTQYVQDGLGNLVKTVSPDAGTSTATFDEAGNLKIRIDANGQEAAYSYDALNRLTSIRYVNANEQNVTYAYDQGKNGIGRLVGMTDVTGSVDYSYDQQGRLISEKRQAWDKIYVTEYSYDKHGRLQRMIYPSGRTVDYSFDAQGRIQKITTTLGDQIRMVISDATYLPFGGVLQFTFGNGQHYVRTYDQDGRIASYTLDDETYKIAYDAASQILSISGTGSIANYAYDMLSRLTKYVQANDMFSFRYDAVGNRISKNIGNSTTSYVYHETNNHLIGIQNNGKPSQNIIYDDDGSIRQDSNWQHSYDVRGRLIKTRMTEGDVSYSVNALGLRVRKQSPENDTIYHYDSLGRLIAESSAGKNSFNKEYIYLDDQPVAVIQ